MDYQTISFVLLLVLGYASYSAYKLKDQIWCTFRRKDNTKIEKFANQRQAKIDFDNGWYDVDPSRVSLMLWTKGIHFFLPTWVRCLDFRHDSSRALDPKTFENTWETPESKKALDKSHAVQQFFAGNRNFLGAKTKVTLLEKYLPLIVILGFVALGYFVWNMQSSLDLIGKGQNAIQALLGQALSK